MTTERIFSDEELRILGLRSIDALDEALDAGDREAAQGFAKRLRREALSMFRNYDGWEVALLDWIEREMGWDVRGEALAVIEDGETASKRHRSHRSRRNPTRSWNVQYERIRGAIEEGDFDEARARALMLHEGALRDHDRGMTRVSALLSWIGRRAGRDGIASALHEAMSAEILGDASFRERAEALMHFTRVHLQPVPLEEDDEKLTFACAACPSGGRMIAAGRYDGPEGDLVVQGPHPLTYGRDELPVYCCHEPIMEMDSIARTGVPLFIVEPAERLGFEPCKTYLYKRPEDIPERFYTRLGLDKAESLARAAKTDEPDGPTPN